MLYGIIIECSEEETSQEIMIFFHVQYSHPKVCVEFLDDSMKNNYFFTGSSSPESARQGSMMMAAQKFPCDYGKFATEAAKAASTKVAFNVALSVGEGLHSWAETSDFDFLLHKLRHLLCLVDDNGNK